MITHCASIREFRLELYKNYLSDDYYEDERTFDMNPNLDMKGGWLTRDPWMTKTKAGVSVAHFRIGCKHSDTVTYFFDCEAWGKQAEFVMKNFNAGRFIMFSGFAKQNDYKKDGTTIKNVVFVAKEIFFGDSKMEIARPPVEEEHPEEGFKGLETSDEEMPF